MTAVGFVAAHALVLLAFTATAYVAGRLATRLLWAAAEGRLRLPPRPAARSLAQEGAPPGGVDAACVVDAMTLGLVVLATLGCLLGLAGWLATAPWLVCVAAIHLAGLGVWRDGWRAAAAATARWRALPRGRRIGLLAAGAATFAPLFVLALYPPTAFDETLYHLPFARAFVESGSLPFLPDLRFPVFPQLAELLSAEMLLVSDDVATHLVSLLAVALIAGLLLGWGREWAAADGSPAAGWLAAAAWLGNPIVVYLAGTGYVEPLLALFVTAALRAFGRWRNEGRRVWLVLAAVFAGAAAGTKYLGLFFVVALAFATIAARSRRAATRPRRGSAAAPDAEVRPREAEGSATARMAAVAPFAAVAAITMAPWYVRILAFTGNPVFPFLSSFFGANAWTPARFRTLGPSSWADLDGEAIIGYFAQLLTLPWDVVARRELVGNLPPFSPFLLLGAPLLLLIAFRDRRMRLLLALAASFVALFPLLPADARHLVTVLPLVSLALGVATARIVGLAAAGSAAARSGAVGWALAAMLALPGWLYAGYCFAREGALPTSAAEREAYLLRRVPLYPAVARLDWALRPGDTVYGLFAEQMRDFVPARFLGDWYGPHRYATIAGVLDQPDALAAALRGMGVDFLLVAREAAAGHSFVEPDARAGFELLYADDAALLYALRPAAEGRPTPVERATPAVRSGAGGT